MGAGPRRHDPAPSSNRSPRRGRSPLRCFLHADFAIFPHLQHSTLLSSSSGSLPHGPRP
uniref:Uncharacterized protein n=1 Tax=Oryza glumipatula TaxID=40148 RepID=A0A0E0BHP6_9ORYZ